MGGRPPPAQRARHAEQRCRHRFRGHVLHSNSARMSITRDVIESLQWMVHPSTRARCLPAEVGRCFRHLPPASFRRQSTALLGEMEVNVWMLTELVACSKRGHDAGTEDACCSMLVHSRAQCAEAAASTAALMRRHALQTHHAEAMAAGVWNLAIPCPARSSVRIASHQTQTEDDSG